MKPQEEPVKKSGKNGKVQAADGKQVRNAGAAEIAHGSIVQPGFVADQHRGGKVSGFPLNDTAQLRGDMGAESR